MALRTTFAETLSVHPDVCRETPIIYHDCPFPAVTSGVLATGMVLAYFVPDPPDYPDQWVPLPYSFLAFGEQYYYNFAYQTNVGIVRRCHETGKGEPK